MAPHFAIAFQLDCCSKSAQAALSALQRRAGRATRLSADQKVQLIVGNRLHAIFATSQRCDPSTITRVVRNRTLADMHEEIHWDAVACVNNNPADPPIVHYLGAIAACLGLALVEKAGCPSCHGWEVLRRVHRSPVAIKRRSGAAWRCKLQTLLLDVYVQLLPLRRLQVCC